MTNNRHNGIFYGVDGWTVLLYVLIVAAGWISITSASYDDSAADLLSFSHFYMKQLMWIGMAWVTAIIVLLLDERFYHMFAYPAYLGGIALLFRGGCIIRSVFLGKIKEAYDKNPELSNLLLDPYFKETMQKLIPAWRKVAAAAVSYGVPAPAMTAALSYFDGYTTERLPANLLQAQRDYFGAHTYERLDSPRGEFFHTNWTGHGGNTAASTYNA